MKRFAILSLAFALFAPIGLSGCTEETKPAEKPAETKPAEKPADAPKAP